MDPRTTPDLATFCQHAAPGRVVPVAREVVADLLTPLEAFRRLDPGPAEAAFLLESVQGGERWGRWSFIGLQPRRLYRTLGQRAETVDARGVHVEEVPDALHWLLERAAEVEVVLTAGLPTRFVGGLVGTLGYDLVRFIERLPARATAELPVYDGYLIEPSVVVALDALRQRATLIAPVRIAPGDDLATVYAAAVASLDAAATALARPAPEVPPAPRRPIAPPVGVPEPLAFLDAVSRAKEFVAAGDVIQVVLSRRFAIDAGGVAPFELYRALRLVNPSPYLFYLRFPEYTVVGASPELLVRREDDAVTVRPIAGTRRRGTTPEDDAAIEAELRADPKEVAEHVMLVDLGRNDVGRLALPGSVVVVDRFVVERYSHVMHLVSGVQGTVPPGTSPEAVFRATFPAGTLSGAPKVRAMELIEALEPTRRGVYGGAAGYIGYGRQANLDLAIAIRSVVAIDDNFYLQVGAGVVFDSVPERELEETNEKARGVLAALELARTAFGPAEGAP